ncbi:hypothetical protein Tco_0996059 [Tanacetum coccineum]
MRDRLRYDDGNVFDRLGHRRQSAFDRLSNTYSPSTTKSGPDRANSRDRSHSRSRPRKWDSSSRDHPRSRGHLYDIEESYGNTCSSYRAEAMYRYHSYGRDRSRSMKIGKESKSPLSRVSESGTRDGGHWKSKRPGGSLENFPSRSAGGTLGNAYVVSHVQLYPNRDCETKEVETGCMNGAPECMRIFGFMHGVNNRELTKRLNEHIPKTMEEMMTATTAFIRGKTVAASKKKCHTSWKPQDHPKQHVSERRSDFRGQPREGRGSNKFTPLMSTPKEILAAEAGKFKLPPPMVTDVFQKL